MKHFEVYCYKTSIDEPPKFVGLLHVYMGSDATPEEASVIALREFGGAANMAEARAQ